MILPSVSTENVHMFDNKKKWQFENFKICSGSTSGNRKVPPLVLEN